MPVSRPRFLVIAFALLVIICAAPALAMDIPPEAAAEFPPYPGSQVSQVIQVDDTTIVILDCGQASLNEVSAYYTNLVEGKGYAITMTNSYPGGTMFMATKGSMEAMFDMGDLEGSVMVTMNLTGEIPAAEAPSSADTSAPVETPAGDQAMAEPVDLEAEMAAALPQYPGSQVLQAISDAEEGMLTMLDCGAAPVDEVYAYYRNSLEENGYTVGTESRTQNNMTLNASRPGFEVVVDVRDVNGTTMASLRLGSTGQPAPDQAGNQAGDQTRDQGEEYGEVTGQEIQGDAGAASASMDAPGAAPQSPIWEYVDPRPGDRILDQYNFMESYVAQIVSDASFAEIMDYYEQALTNAGWDLKMHVLDDESGMMTLAKGNMTIQMGPDDDPAGQGTGYMLVLHGAQ